MQPHISTEPKVIHKAQLDLSRKSEVHRNKSIKFVTGNKIFTRRTQSIVA